MMVNPQQEPQQGLREESSRIWPAMPWLLACALTALIFFPAGIRPGIWGAPLESGAGLVSLVVVWLMAWLASALAIPRRHYLIGWAIAGLLLLSKLVFVSLMPMQGVEARIQPVDRDEPIAQTVSPLRPVGPHGWPLFQTTAVPPLFINDIRHYDFYGPQQHRRREVAYNLELSGYAALSETMRLFAGSDFQEDNLTTHAETGGISFRLQGDATAGDNVPSALFAIDGPGKRNHLTANRLYPAAPKSLPPPAIKWLAGNWSIFFIVALLAMSGYLALQLTESAGRQRRIVRFALPILVTIGALLIPIAHPVDSVRVVIVGIMGIAGAAMLYRNRSRLQPIHYRALHAVLLFAWCIIATRFFLDRYPDGYMILAGGSDSLFHYTFASEIIRGDWLHSVDAPFSRQFFMRYIIAAVMIFVGEGPAWSIIINAFAYGVIGLQIASVARTCGGRYWQALPLFWLAFAFISPFKMWIPTLFPEVMSILFLVAMVDQLCKWHYYGRTNSWRVIAAAAWFGIAVYARNNFILSAPVIAALLCYNPTQPAPAKAWQWRPAILFSAIVVALVALVALRNTLLARPGEPFTILLSQKIKAKALYQGFIPAFIGDPDLLSRYGSLPLDQQFLNALQERPMLYLRYVLDRISVMLGGPAMIEPNLVTHYPRFNPVNSVLFGGATLMTILLAFRRRCMGFPGILAWSLILPQIALVVMMIGYVGEGYRFLLPCYPLLIIILACNCHDTGKVE